jgi:hypothetical protein
MNWIILCDFCKKWSIGDHRELKCRHCKTDKVWHIKDYS